MKVLKNAVGLTARLRPKRCIQKFGNLAFTKTTIHRAALWSCYLRFVPVSKISISRVFEKIFAFSTQTGQSNFVHRKIFMSFQTQINQSNFLCECGCWKRKWRCVWYRNILCDRTNVPTGFFVTGSLLDRRHQPCNCLNKSCLRVDCFNHRAKD